VRPKPSSSPSSPPPAFLNTSQKMHGGLGVLGLPRSPMHQGGAPRVAWEEGAPQAPKPPKLLLGSVVRGWESPQGWLGKSGRPKHPSSPSTPSYLPPALLNTSQKRLGWLGVLGLPRSPMHQGGAPRVAWEEGAAQAPKPPKLLLGSVVRGWESPQGLLGERGRHKPPSSPSSHPPALLNTSQKRFGGLGVLCLPRSPMHQGGAPRVAWEEGAAQAPKPPKLLLGSVVRGWESPQGGAAQAPKLPKLPSTSPLEHLPKDAWGAWGLGPPSFSHAPRGCPKGGLGRGGGPSPQAPQAHFGQCC